MASIAHCPTMQVSIDFDEQTDFAALGAYAWVPSQPVPAADDGSGKASEPRVWITDAVDEMLSEKGFRLDPATPDFLVTYEPPLDRRGTLTLAFVRADNRQSIWRGRSIDQAYLARNAAAWERRVRAAVELLLERFPPGQ